MTDSSTHRFPVAVFVSTTLFQLGVAVAAFWFFFPRAFSLEVRQAWWIVPMALFFGFPLSLFEYMYHRYMLHSAILPFLGRMHSAHREHHDLTTVKAPVRPATPDLMVPVTSKYPVVHEDQEESMMFPAYALSIFLAMFTVVFALPMKLLLPLAPTELGLILGVTLYYSSYEVWHAILHMPFDRYWKPKMESKVFGPTTRYVYSFHLMHHWRPTANLAVVGFWGAALWDHIFRTHRRPKNMPLEGASVNYDDASLLKPIWPVSMIDKWQPAMYRWSRSVEQGAVHLFRRRAHRKG